jgi:lysophospholipase L1-like esterase
MSSVITNPSAARILCFGDSNTHGIPADPQDDVRLAADARWTGRLQALLGHGYDVIEEGLSGRTTDVDYAERPGANGRPYFGPCLQTHHPLDVVVIMLGTNDLKTQFGRTAADIANALTGYIDDIDVNVANREGGSPVTILVSPAPLDDSRPGFAERTEGNFDHVSVANSRQLAAEIGRVARARGVVFADAAGVARVGDDGIHLSPDSHQPLAELLAAVITGAAR